MRPGLGLRSRGIAAVIAVALSTVIARADDPAPPAPPPTTETSQPAPAAETAPAKNAAPETTAAPNETLAPGTTIAILGKKVRDAAGKDMGLVIDVLVNGDGAPIAAVVDVGGFLGVGSRKIAVDWKLFQFKPSDANNPVILPLDRAHVQAAPEYKPAAQQPIPIVAAPAQNGAEPAAGK